jgi:Metallo-beta-lactamase superfamily
MPHPKQPTRQTPGVHHFAFGDIVVTALNDGMLGAPMLDFFDFVTNVPRREAEAMHRAAFLAVPPRLAVNCYLVYLADRLVLIDGGCGAVFGPSLGRLAGNLAALGVKPADIDTVLVTHLHPDHVGGLVDAGGQAVFPNAELVVHAVESAYWSDPAVLAAAPEGQEKQAVRLSLATIAAYRDRTRSVTGGEVLGGVTAVPAPGHTPGHTGWLSRRAVTDCWSGATSSTCRACSSRARTPAWRSTSMARWRSRPAAGSWTWRPPTGCAWPACTWTSPASATWSVPAAATRSSGSRGTGSWANTEAH